MHSSQINEVDRSPSPRVESPITLREAARRLVGEASNSKQLGLVGSILDIKLPPPGIATIRAGQSPDEMPQRPAERHRDIAAEFNRKSKATTTFQIGENIPFTSRRGGRSPVSAVLRRCTLFAAQKGGKTPLNRSPVCSTPRPASNMHALLVSLMHTRFLWAAILRRTKLVPGKPTTLMEK